MCQLINPLGLLQNCNQKHKLQFFLCLRIHFCRFSYSKVKCYVEITPQSPQIGHKLNFSKMTLENP